MANSPQVNINLIGKPRVEFAQNFLKWTFNIGRIVIAATELVALLALGYRFYIDRKIIDLHDQIKREQLFVASQASKEAVYVSIENRLANIKITQKNTNIKVDILNSILDSISKGNFSSTNISIDISSVRIEGIAYSIFPINNFIDELKKNPNVSSISLDDFSSTDTGIQFKMSIEINNLSS
ncbi:MAG TPA: PilN domain-containing protein [Patescibacteria group bacterium]|nr:PilN domain-containing protein [Patescibacteria group bacterium]